MSYHNINYHNKRSYTPAEYYLFEIEQYYHYQANAYHRVFKNRCDHLRFAYKPFEYTSYPDFVRKAALTISYADYRKNNITYRMSAESIISLFDVIVKKEDLLALIDLFLMNIQEIGDYKNKIIEKCGERDLRSFAKTLCKVYDRNFEVVNMSIVNTLFEEGDCDDWDFLACWFLFWEHVNLQFLGANISNRIDIFNKRKNQYVLLVNEQVKQEQLCSIRSEIESAICELNNLLQVIGDTEKIILSENNTNRNTLQEFVKGGWVKKYVLFFKYLYITKNTKARLGDCIFQIEKYVNVDKRLNIDGEFAPKLGELYRTVKEKESLLYDGLNELHDLYNQKTKVVSMNFRKEIKINNKTFRINITPTSYNVCLLFTDKGIVKESNSIMKGNHCDIIYKWIKDNVSCYFKFIGPHSLDYAIDIDGVFYDRNNRVWNFCPQTSDNSVVTNQERNPYYDWDSIK